MSVLDLKTGAPAPWHSLQVAAYEHANLVAGNFFDFDPQFHVYRKVSGQIVPNVTTILKDMGLISEFAMQSEHARERGTMVHIAGALLPDRLDWSTVDPRIIGYVISLAEWYDRTGCIVEAQEQQVYIPALNVAGTLDLRGTFKNGKSGTLYLHEDGSLATFKACDVRQDYKVFASICNFWRWKNGST